MPAPISKPGSSTRKPVSAGARKLHETTAKSTETSSEIADDHREAMQLREVDTLFRAAGLTRNRREKPVGIRRRSQFQPLTPEELTPVRPTPTIAGNGAEVIKVGAWSRLPWLWQGFSTRRGGLTRAYCPEDACGELNLGFTPEDDRALVLRNRELLVEAVTGNHATPLVTLRQVHSNVLVLGRVETAGPGGSQTPSKGDGLMTAAPGIVLGVQTADCIPVLVADRKRRAVAAFHAGWRGTVKRIVESGIGRMRLEFGSRPEDLVAAIGPGVGACCYSVGDEVLSEFTSQFSYASELFREVYDTDPVLTKYPMLFLTQRAPGHSPIGPSLHLDLVQANRRQLLAAGLKPRSIQVVGGCTGCHRDLFFSHRISHGRCGRMMSVIGVKEV